MEIDDTVTGDAIDIRPTALEDVYGFWECVSSVASEGMFLSFVDAPEFESARGWVANVLDSGFPHFVAHHQGKIVGWIDIAPNPRIMYAHAGRLGMGILREYRARGLGTRLMSTAISRAWDCGLERIELDVFESNLPARKLYEKCGFVLEGRKRRARKHMGAYEDILVMGLLREDASP